MFKICSKLLCCFLMMVKSTPIFACGGAGMTQYFPLASDANGHIWSLAIHTSRDARTLNHHFNSYLLLTNKNLEILDSVFVFLNMPTFNVTLSTSEDYDAVNPLPKIDSIYNLGVQVLAQMHPDVHWFKLLGYAEHGEYGKGPIQFIREREIHEMRDSFKFRGKDSVLVYYDTLYSIREIEYYGQKTASFQILSIDKSFDGWDMDTKSATMSSVRVYAMPSGDLLLMLHFNVMGFHGLYEKAEWHAYSESTDLMNTASKNQTLSWHHNGADHFVFLTNH